MWIPDPRFENPQSLEPWKKPVGPLAANTASPLSSGLIGLFPFGHQHGFENLSDPSNPLIPVYGAGFPEASKYQLTSRGVLTDDLSGSTSSAHRRLDFSFPSMANNTAAASTFLIVFDTYRSANAGSNRDIVLTSNNGFDAATDHYVFMNNSGAGAGEVQAFSAGNNNRFATGIDLEDSGENQTHAVISSVNQVTKQGYIAYNFERNRRALSAAQNPSPGASGFTRADIVDYVSFLASVTSPAPGKNFYGECFLIAVWDKPLSRSQCESVVRNPYQFLIPA